MEFSLCYFLYIAKKRKKHSSAKQRASQLVFRDLVIVSTFVLTLLLAFFIWRSGGPDVDAATLASQYSYTLTGSSATIPNAAAANASAKLNLLGNWSQSEFGVHFAGDLVSQQSVAYAKPTSGPTINATAKEAVGVAVKFQYQAPAGATCFKDSPNITQIGRFAKNTAQIKLQLSNCGKSKTQVFVQCRVAGASSPTNYYPVTGKQALVDGGVYVVKCIKEPDLSNGKAMIRLTTTQIDPVNGNKMTTDSFTVPKTGAIKSTTYLSVGNKYKLSSLPSNTDQFVGDISKVAYCKSTTENVQKCLNTEIPE